LLGLNLTTFVEDGSNPYSLPRSSVRDKLPTRRLTVVSGDVPKSPFIALGRVAAVGRHDLSGDCRLFWLSTQIHLLFPRLRAAFQAASNAF
jgi:hypothetical protein